jgi:hypothetical protein
MRRTGQRWLLVVLAALIVAAGCTGRSDEHREPPPPPQVFLPIADRSETGNSEYLADVATDGATAVIVGAVHNGAIFPTFRVSRDAGATWQEGRLDDGSAAATRAGADEQVGRVVRLPGRWYAIGHSNDKVLAWDSVDGQVWRRIELDRRVLDPDTDGVEELTVVGSSLVAVGSRTPAGGAARPMAWTSADGTVWAASPIAGMGELRGVAARGPVVVAAGSDDDTFLVARSADSGRTWQRASQVPTPSGDSDFRREFSDVAAGPNGFVAVGDAWTTGYVPIVYRSADGRQWHQVGSGAIGSAGSSSADLVAASDSEVFVATSVTESRDGVRGWLLDGARWSEVATPPTSGTGRAQGISWVLRSVAPSRAGWLVLVQRQANSGLSSEIWRSTSANGRLTRVSAPWSGDTRPLVVPFALTTVTNQLIAGGTSQGLPVVWAGDSSGLAFGPPEPVSTTVGDGLDGLASSGDQLLAFGTHQRGANGTVAVTWLRSGSGAWSRGGLPTFQTSMSDYAYSRIAAVAKIGKRWYAVGERSDNGSANVSALIFSSTDGRSWVAGTAAKVSRRATDGGYELSDLSGSDNVSRRMTAITGTSRGLVAVGSTGTDDAPSAATWRSANGKVWSLTPLPAAGFQRSQASAVSSRGSRTVAVGVGWRPGSSKAVPLSWLSDDDGRSWRTMRVAEDQVDPAVLQLASTTSHFVIVGLRTGGSPEPLAWKSDDGTSWRSLELAGTAPIDAEGVTLTGVIGVGSDLVGLLSRSALSGTETTLHRQTVG